MATTTSSSMRVKAHRLSLWHFMECLPQKVE
jgi:hypothetical protein